MVSLRRLQTVYRGLGPLGMLRHIVERVRYAVGLPSPFYRRIAEVDRAFDRAHGVETGGIHRLSRMTLVGASADQGSGYIACDPADFADAMQALPPPLDAYTFIDLGSGKGRALLLATAYPFRRIIGVEFSAELHHAAQANFTKRPDPRVDLVLADCLTYAFPRDPLVLYLHNPFDEKLVQAVADRAMRAWRETPRGFWVVYLNPRHAACWQASGWRNVARSGTRPAPRQTWMVFTARD